MMAVLQSSSLDNFSKQRKTKFVEGKAASRLSLRDRQIIELHLCGKRARQISEICGVGVVTVYRVLASEEGISHKQQIMQYYDNRFEVLYGDVIDTIEDGLLSEDMTIRLQAADKWLKAHGKFAPKVSDSQVNITAEDIVFNILNQSGE
jgi:hypothetical protein